MFIFPFGDAMYKVWVIYFFYYLQPQILKVSNFLVAKTIYLNLLVLVSFQPKCMGTLCFCKKFLFVLLYVNTIHIFHYASKLEVTRKPPLLDELTSFGRRESVPTILGPYLVLLGKVKTAGQDCGFRASSGDSLEWQLTEGEHFWEINVVKFLFVYILWT